MISFGKVWEKRLERLWKDESKKMSDISRELKVDPITVKRYAEKLNLSFDRKGKNYKRLAKKDKLKTIENQDNTLLLNRELWRSIVIENKDVKLKVLRKKHSKLYGWLHSNDKDWLKKNIPNLRVKPLAKNYVDWDKRDIKIKNDLKLKHSELIMRDERPRKITISLLGIETKYHSLLLRKLHKLPKTKEALDELVEDDISYALRKIKWVALKFREGNFFYNKWNLLLSSCTYRHRFDKKVQDLINQELQTQKSNSLL